MPSYRPHAKHQPGLRRELLGERLLQTAPGRGQARAAAGRRAAVAGGSASRSSSASPHGCGRHDHAGAAAVRGVVDGAVPVGGVTSAGRAPAARPARPHGPARAATARSGRRYSGKIVTTSMRTSGLLTVGRGVCGDDRVAVVEQPGRGVHDDPAGRRRRPRGRSRGRTAPAPRCRPGGRPPARPAPAGAAPSATSPTDGTVGVDDGEADQLVVVPLVVLVGRRRPGRRRPAAGCRAAPRPPCGRRHPSNRTSRRPLWSWAVRTVSGPRSGGSVSRTEPGARRVSGSSVRTSTVTSPLTPCARPTRRDHQQHRRSAHLVDVDEVDADPAGRAHARR